MRDEQAKTMDVSRVADRLVRTHPLELRVPPLIVWLVFAAATLGAAAVAPEWSIRLPGRAWLAAAILVASLWIVGLGVWQFRRARTTVNPLSPAAASALVMNGVYRRTRNPMYVGFASSLVALMVYLSHPAAILAVVGFVAFMNRFQIEPEERALRAIFGAEFDEYAARVRRWL